MDKAEVPATRTALEEMTADRDAWKARAEALANADPVITSMERLVNEYGANGMFIVGRTKIAAPDLLVELKNGSEIGNGFRVKMYTAILHYFMSFGGKKDD